MILRHDWIFVVCLVVAISGSVAVGQQEEPKPRSIPDATELATVQARIRRDFSDLLEIDPDVEPLVWAKFLLEQSKWKDTTSHFAALHDAARTASHAGGIELAVKALEQIKERFNLSVGPTVVTMLQGQATTMTPEMASAWLDEIEIWMVQDRFGDCLDVSKQVANLVVKPDAVLSKRLDGLIDANTTYAQWFTQRPGAEPTDDGEREAEGRCLAVQREWEPAMKLLTSARDVNLRKAAATDIEATTKKAKPSAACLAWLRVVAAQPTIPVWHDRATYWYDQAATGERTPAVATLERRMKQLGLLETASTPQSGSSTGGGKFPPLTLRQTHAAHTGIVNSVAVSDDGSAYCSAGEDGAVKMWKPGDDEPFQTLSGNGAVFCVDISRDGKFVATGGRDKIFRVWNVNTGDATAYSETHTVSIRDVAFGHNDKWAVTVSDDRKVVLWALDRQTPVVVPGHMGIVYGVAASAKGKWVASASEDRVVQVFRPTSSPQVTQLKGHDIAVHAVEFSPDETRLFSGAADGTIYVWDLSDGSSEPFAAHEGVITAISFAGNGSSFATSGKDASVHIWDARTLTKLQTIGPLRDEIRDVAFASDGRSLIVASKDGRVLVYGAK
jgi:hypothetical protein